MCYCLSTLSDAAVADEAVCSPVVASSSVPTAQRPQCCSFQTPNKLLINRFKWYLSQSRIHADGCNANKSSALIAEPLTGTHLDANLVYYVLWLHIVSTLFQSIRRTKIMIFYRKTENTFAFSEQRMNLHRLCTITNSYN